MASKLITTHELSGTRTYITKKRNGKTKRIGKVRRFVFHPKEKRCLGFIVKRPDLLWMIRREDLFVAFDGFDIDDGHIIVHSTPEASGNTAIKNLDVNWNYCVYWIGMPIVTADNTSFGFVGNVTLDMKTGMVESIETSTGTTENALLGKRTIPASMIKGFRRGIGTAVVQTTEEGAKVESDQAILGAILVSDAAKEVEIEGGLAEQAGKATAIVTNRVSKTIDKAKPTVQRVTKATGEAINQGAYVTGRQIARSTTMFSDFKKEYDKARWGEPEKLKKSSSQKSSAKASSAKSSAGKASSAKAPAKASAKASSMKLTKLGDTTASSAASKNSATTKSASTKQESTKATSTNTSAANTAATKTTAAKSAGATSAKATSAKTSAAKTSSKAATNKSSAAKTTAAKSSSTKATTTKAATTKTTATKAATTTKTTATQTEKTYTGPKLRKL